MKCSMDHIIQRSVDLELSGADLLQPLKLPIIREKYVWVIEPAEAYS